MGRERVEVLDFLDHQDLLVTGGRLEISPRSLDLLDPQDPRELLETLAFLAKMETLAPLLINSFATSRPIPLDPPVTRTCFPFKSLLGFGFLPENVL